MFGNYITVAKLDTTSIGNNAQSQALEELAEARAEQAKNNAAQAQNNTQKAEAPNDVNAYIGTLRPRLDDGHDLIDISELTAKAAAESFESQGLKQDAAVEEKLGYYPFPSAASATNTAAQAQNSGQDVDSRNAINARIDHPAWGLEWGAPKADILVDKLDSAGSGSSVQLQDLAQKADVKEMVASFCAPITLGEASNAGAQAANSGQTVDSGNHVNITEHIGGYMPALVFPDPSVTRLTTTSTGENVQAQKAAQEALTAVQGAWGGADASNELAGAQNSTQDVNSGNWVNMNVNDRVSTFQSAIAERLSSASTGTNLQDQAGTQKAISAYFGDADNLGTQGQNSAQDIGSRNWVNIQM
jgi:hypothetical protein